MKISAKRVAARRTEVKKVLMSVNLEVARLPNMALTKLAPVMVEAQKELAKSLQKWLATMDGKESFTSFQLRKGLLSIRSGLDAIKEVQPHLYQSLKLGGKMGERLASSHLEKELALLSFNFQGSLNPTPILPAVKILDKMQLDRFARFSKKWTTEAVENVRRKLALGVVLNENMDQLTNRLLGKYKRKFTEDATPAAKADKISDILWNSERYNAERVVRTEVISAYNEGKAETIQEIGKEDATLVQEWNAALDSRTCEDCEEMDGEQVPIGTKFSSGDYAPPLHPNCRCTIGLARED